MQQHRLPLLLIIGIFLGCVKSFATHGVSIKMDLEDDPVTLNPYKSSDSITAPVLQNIFEPLLDYEFVGEKVLLKSSILTNITSGLNYTLWTFNIDHNKKWSDGSALTNSQVVDGLFQMLAPANTNPRINSFFVIQGAEEYHLGKITKRQDVGIRLVGKDRIEFKLKRPMIFFPHLLTQEITTPWHSNHEKFFQSQDSKDFITLAPYVFSIYKLGEKIIIKKNTQYKSSDSYDEIEFLIIKNKQTAINLFKKNQIDMVTSVPFDQLVNLKAEALKIKTFPISSYIYLGFNCESDKFKVLSRRQNIKNHIEKINQWPEVGSIKLFNYLPGEEPLPKINSHISDSFSFKTLLFKDSIHKTYIEFLQAELKKQNIVMQLELREWKSLVNEIKSGTAESFVLGLAAWYDHSNALLENIVLANNFHWQNLEVKKNYDDWLLDSDPKKLKKLLEKIGAEAPMVPLLQIQRHVLLSDRIKNFKPWPFLRYRF